MEDAHKALALRTRPHGMATLCEAAVVIVATAVLQWYTEMQAEMMMEPPYVGLNLWLIAQNDCLINFLTQFLI